MEIPEDKAYVSIKPKEAAFLYDLIREKGLGRTLETGLGFGRSAIHMLAAHGGRHIAVDPYQRDYDYLALRNVEAAGLSNRFDFHEDASHNVLPRLHLDGERLDLVFIDGDHKFDGILVDFYYADLLLDPGGYVVFHDTWMRSTQLVASFIRKNKANYRRVACPLRNMLVFRKSDRSDGRDGIHFMEFYTYRSLLKFRLIHWMLQPGYSPLKSAARKLKDMLK